MRILVDLNIVLDVVLRREPLDEASARVLSQITDGLYVGCYYLVNQHSDRSRAEQVVDFLLKHLEVIPEGPDEFHRARTFAFSDFEDAVTAATAATGRCSILVTRNVKDFGASPVPAMTPEEFLDLEQEGF